MWHGARSRWWTHQAVTAKGKKLHGNPRWVGESSLRIRVPGKVEKERRDWGGRGRQNASTRKKEKEKFTVATDGSHSRVRSHSGVRSWNPCNRCPYQPHLFSWFILFDVSPSHQLSSAFLSCGKPISNYRLSSSVRRYPCLLLVQCWSSPWELIILQDTGREHTY